MKSVVALISQLELELNSIELAVKIRSHFVDSNWQISEMSPSYHQFMLSMLKAILASKEEVSKVVASDRRRGVVSYHLHHDLLLDYPYSLKLVRVQQEGWRRSHLTYAL